MATLKDIWDYPNNSSSGYAQNTDNWSGDNSYGLDKRIEDLRTGTYTAWPNINPSTDLTRNGVILNTQDLSTALSQYSNYVDSFSDDTNLTFRQIYKHELAEMSSFVNGAKVTAVVTEIDTVSGLPAVKMTTDSTTPHNLTSGDAISGFAFSNDIADDSYYESMNYDQHYVRVIDANNVYLYEDSALTTPAYFGTSEGTAKAEHIPTMYSIFPHDDGTYDGALIAFPNEGFPGTLEVVPGSSPTAYQVTPQTSLTDQIPNGTKFIVTAQHTGAGTAANPNPGGTFGSATAGDEVYLKYFRKNVYKMYTDSAMTVPYTVASNPYSYVFDSGTQTISASTTYKTVSGVISDTGLQNFIKSHAMLFQHDNLPAYGEPLYQGLCRVQLVTGTSTSTTKTIPSNLDESEYFHYSFNSVTNAFVVYEDLYNEPNSTSIWTTGAYGDYYHNQYTDNFLTPPSVDEPKGLEIDTVTSGAYRYKVEFCSMFEVSPHDDETTTGGLWRDDVSQTLAVGSQAGGILTNPLIGKYDVFFDHTGVTSTSSTWPSVTDLTAGITNNTTMFLPGNQVYSYQDSSNVTQYAAGNIDFTKRWRPRYLDGPAVEQSVTWITNPVVVPNVNSSGYVDNTYTITNPGAITLGNYYQSIYSDATVSESAWLTNIENGPFVSGTTFPNFNWNWGVSKFQQRADEYVAPTPYWEDFFDRGNEWDTEAYDGANAKQWPKHITPSSIKVVQATPSSVTTSQSGVKYVRASGIIRHQIQVEYPPMDETAFREFEATVAAARGQATPFYFDFYGYGSGSTTIAFNRIDDNNIYNTVALRYPVTKGDNYITLEGYQANQTDAVLPGEYMVLGGSADGGLLQTVSGDDSNVFGEIKFRMAVGSKFDYPAGGRLHKNPAHAIVTIAEDTLEYTIGTDQLYRFSVRFDWDQWK